MRFIVGRNKCSLFRVLPRHLFPMHPSGALVKTQIKWLARSRILKLCGDLIHSDRFQDLTVTSFYRGSGTTDLTEGSGFGLRVSRPALFRRTTISESWSGIKLRNALEPRVVTVPAYNEPISFLAEGSSGRPAHRFKSEYFDDFPELLQRIPRSQQAFSAPL